MAAQNLRFAMSLILINALLAFAWGAIDWRAHVGGFVVGAIAGMAAEGLPNHAHRTATTLLGFAGPWPPGSGWAWRTVDLRSMFGL